MPAVIGLALVALRAIIAVSCIIRRHEQELVDEAKAAMPGRRA